MVQQDTSLIKNKIMKFIEDNGPSLPTHVASEISQSMLFSSAFLAELLSEKKLVISHMKVGSSPVYLVSGQESLLERYAVYLGGKPGEAYSLLKEKKYLKDSEQVPPIRVALRSIKDFAKPFRFKEDIYWRYLTNSVEDFLVEKSEEKKDVKRESGANDEDVVEQKVLAEGEVKESNSDEVLFVDKVREYLKVNNIFILEETYIRKKEFSGRGRIQSEVGEVEVLVIGKDKKIISEKDIEKVFEEIINKKMLALFLSTGEISKKTKDFYRDYKNLIRFIKI